MDANKWMPKNGCQQMDAKKWMPTNGCQKMDAARSHEKSKKTTFQKKIVVEPWDLAS